MSPWLMPIQDNLQFLMGNDKIMLQEYLDRGTIEMEAITYIRGRSISKAFIIIDDKGNKVDVVDEEPFRVDFEKLKQLRSVFKKDGTITAANASTINDGAAMCLISSEDNASNLNINPVARILDYASFSHDPEWFTTAPVSAIKKLLDQNNLSLDDIDLFEINEAFSVVSLVAIKELNLDIEKVNVHGGAVSLGHPIGCSGTRIVMSLINALKIKGKKLGVAAICIGGGEATAMLIENI